MRNSYKKAEQRARESSVPHANLTLEQVAQMYGECLTIHAVAGAVLSANRAETDRLNEAAMRDRNIVAIDDSVDEPDHGPRGLGIAEYDDQPEELWKLLRNYQEYFKQKPKTVADYHCRSNYAFSSILLLDQFMYRTLYGKKSALDAWEKSKSDAHDSGMRNVRTIIRAAIAEVEQGKVPKKRTPPSPAVLCRVRAGSPSARREAGVASSSTDTENAEWIMPDVDCLGNTEYQTSLDDDTEEPDSKCTWKLVTHSFDHRTREWQYGVLFSYMSADDAPTMLGKPQLEYLLQRSTEEAAID